MAAETAIADLVNRLEATNNKTEALEELKTVICAVPPSELRNVLPNISVTNVFNCLNTSNKKEQEACGEVLDRMLSTLSAPVVLEHFHSHILTWLNLPDERVQVLCLPLLTRLSRDAPESLCQHTDLVLAVVSLLTADSLDIGPAAAAILTHMGRNPSGLQVLFNEQTVQHLRAAMQRTDTCRFRVYQIATDLSMLAPAALDACVSSGVLQQLINEMQKDDILVQLNAIELLSDLAQSPHGLVFLDQHGIVGKLEEMMVGVSDNPMSGLLLPGLIKFFGGLARHHPKEVLSKFDNFVRLVLMNVCGGDASLQGVSVDTLAFISSTPEGKLALEKLGNPMTECIQGIGSLIQTGSSELKVRALRAMSSIVYLQVEHQTVELLTLTERWFGTSMSLPFDSVWSIAQQPFSDLRIPALHLLQSVALCPWGQKLMNNCPGFREYVLDRATENTKEGKDEKFELVRILAHSPTAVEILGRPYHVKLMEYFNQGPFFVLAQSEVALEGE
ncbi:26S proteasome non-ATPase regulatory subunit 5 [Aplysia californica]|uniref:26S proteasome non-ATPase regulatory subunit 5 n=1 Tax=Aplysia californica TaxID=6500 RepID=A0ABM0K6J5_APLCA|nr:26S proteasome non-ATPase regulatory subunit 5 [Aplysia californica]